MADGHLITGDGLLLQPEKGHQHIMALDGLRGLAILMVMAQHFTVLEKGAVVDRMLGAAGRFGWTGVDLFFTLSGFLITGILLNSRNQSSYFRNFYARRALRIFPLYYLLVAFGLFILPQFSQVSMNENFRPIPMSHWPFFFTYTGNWIIAFTSDRFNDVFGITWSLAIEEQFYIVWPLVILFCRPKKIMQICVGLFVASAAIRIAMQLNGAPRNAMYVFTPCRLDAISLGSLLAVIVRQKGLSSLRRALPLLKKIAVGCALAVAAICVYHKSTGWDRGPGQMVGYSLVAVLCSILLVNVLLSSNETKFGRFFTSSPLRFFGKYSYGIYIVHMPMMRYIKSYWYGPDKFLTIHGAKVPGQLLFYVICFVPAVLGALVTWNLIEKHMLKLKRYFPTHPPVERREVTMTAIAEELAPQELALVS